MLIQLTSTVIASYLSFRWRRYPYHHVLLLSFILLNWYSFLELMSVGSGHFQLGQVTPGWVRSQIIGVHFHRPDVLPVA